MSQWLDLIKVYFSYAWMADEKGAGGIVREEHRYVSLCGLDEEINPARRTQLAAAVCAEQRQNISDRGSLWW